ncbi:MAG: hypothetical protein JWN38_320 [Candidatus Saccharibacteria bacterium]|nr:hypothetical protein [Candidatus Saccharibacteria bacterium]
MSRALHFLAKHKVSLLLLVVIGAALSFGPITYTVLATRGERYDLSRQATSAVPKRQVAMVFGAGVFPDGTPTPYLKGRIQTAVTLYKAGRVKIILMTGDNSSSHYNEPLAMRRYAEQLGIPPKAIVLDYAGFNTYDSCYRAAHIFQIHQAIIVTQAYHLPRAMATCSGLGVKTLGVEAQHASRDWTVSYLLREVLSTDKMVIQNVFKPQPTVLGKPEPIN